MILFLVDLEPQDGGELEFYPGCKAWTPPASEESSVQPVRVPCHAGTLVLMDGTRCYHRVAPILRPCCRITVPMVFPNVIEDRRPDALDSYLYDESEPSAAA
jgi:hypothetical protein